MNHTFLSLITTEFTYVTSLGEWLKSLCSWWFCAPFYFFDKGYPKCTVSMKSAWTCLDCFAMPMLVRASHASFGGWTHRERICVLQRIPETPMHYSARWNLHVRFMADSSRIHREFMPVSFSPKKSKSCQIHATFMAVSWRLHIQAWPGYSLPRSIEKMIQKVGFSCRFGFLGWFQSHFWQYVRFM